MNKYVKFYENVFTDIDCNTILDKRIKASKLIDGNFTDLLSFKSDQDEYWVDTFECIEDRLKPFIKDYLDGLDGLFPRQALDISHIGFLNDHSGSFTELHYDWELVNVAGNLIIKPFVVLLYLNHVDEGGELIFPYQNLTFKPQKGSIVVLPCSYTHPHLSMPVTAGTKHICRITFKLDEECIKVDELEI